MLSTASPLSNSMQLTVESNSGFLCFCFSFGVIGSENLHHFLKRSDSKLRQSQSSHWHFTMLKAVACFSFSSVWHRVK